MARDMSTSSIVRFVVLLGVSTITSEVNGLDNNIGATPPMGFNDWNELAAKYKPWMNGVDESIILAIGNALVSTGLRDAGYEYLNLDCGYSSGVTNSHKPLEINSTKFPSGLTSLGNTIHNMGLKFGIYSSGTSCCDKNVRLGMEESDAQQFKAWGVDYIKYDDCGTTTKSFIKMRDALNNTGRPMFYSIHSPWTHSPNSGTTNGPDPNSSVHIANCWRTTNDIKNDFMHIMTRAHYNNQFAHLAGPHHFNDPDMLEIGNEYVTDAQGRTQFSLWCLMKAPLLIGTDLTTSSKATIATLGNKHAIAVNQDVLGIQGVQIRNGSDYELWGGKLSAGCATTLVINKGDQPIVTTNVSWSDLGVAEDVKMDVFSIWKDKTVATAVVGSFKLEASGINDCGFYKLCPSTSSSSSSH